MKEITSRSLRPSRLNNKTSPSTNLKSVKISVHQCPNNTPDLSDKDLSSSN